MRLGTDPIEQFFAAPWWTGVQGIAAVLGLIAIVIAVVDFVLLQNRDTPKAMSFDINRSPIVENDRIEVSVTARPMGPHVLYEPEWTVTDREGWDLPDLPTTLTVTDEPPTLMLHLPADDLASVRVGIVWVVPRRWTSHAAGSRAQVVPPYEYEVWKLYRWR